MFTLGRYPVHIEPKKGEQPRHEIKKRQKKLQGGKTNTKLERKREKIKVEDGNARIPDGEYKY